MYILAIDQGTTSTRVVLYDNLFNPIITTQKPLQQIYPHKGHVEHDAEQIFNDVIYLVKQNIKQSAAKLNTSEKTLTSAIKSIGITNQRETIVIWDKQTGKPVHNAIVWQDRRTTDFCEAIKNQNLESKIYDKTGLVIDPYFSASKINWILEKYNLYNNNILTGTIDSYIIYRLTNGKSHYTDVTNASRTQIYNINSLKWDEDLLEIFNIPSNILPDVKECQDYYGLVDKSYFDVEIPIHGVAGDQQAAAIGQLCYEEADCKITYGTGSFVLQNTGTIKISSKHNLLSTIAYKINNKTTYALEGSIFSSGAIIKWLIEDLKLIKNPHDSESIANSINDSNGVYLIPAFTGLGAPYWLPNAKAAITGLTRDTDYRHIVRAALEAVCYQTQDLLAILQGDYKKSNFIKVDGGMTANNWLLQFIADITRIDVLKPDDIESTVRGAAYLAAIGSGIYRSLDDIPKNINKYTHYQPKQDINISNKLYSGWQQEISKIL